MNTIYSRNLVINFCLFLVILLAPLVNRAEAATPDPTEQMRPFVQKIVNILTDPELQGDEQCSKRRQLVMDVAHERFDFAEMSKRVLGREWRQLSGSEQKTFIGLFTTLLEHAYIGKIEDYSKQKVEFQGQRIRHDKAQVDTILIDKNVTIPVSYIMLLKNDNWMVYDIVVEGVSLVRNYMDQFNEIIRKDGYDSLLKRMQERIKELEANAGKSCPTDLPVEDNKSDS